MRSPLAFTVTGAVALGALLAGSRDSPRPDQHPGTAAWYARLRKPSFTPPGVVFGLAWPVLDGLLWYSGYRLARATRSQPRTVALLTWFLTLCGIPGYSWSFFGRHRADLGLGASAGMLAAATGLTATAARVDRRAANANVPLVLWLLFATALQEEVWRRNR